MRKASDAILPSETAFLAMCKEHGLRVTPQRLAVLKALSGSEDHPTADAVYRLVRKEHPNISFDTVNRTLLTFAEVGVVDIVEGRGGPRRFDPNMTKHHHVHCVRCGRIVDFYSDVFDGLEIPREVEERFTVLTKKVAITAICRDCDTEQCPALTNVAEKRPVTGGTE
jgi:Fur family transcriptional regulator, peroxide stress response regulator